MPFLKMNTMKMIIGAVALIISGYFLGAMMSGREIPKW